MDKTFLPNNYQSALTLMESQKAIKEIKDFFQTQLADNLHLHRVSAPLFVRRDSGLNDNLSGTERPVGFDVQLDGQGERLEVVQSLAKWKRYALKKYGIPVGQGIYADMNAIRADEEVGPIHSMYVDQWDWEKVITKEERTLDYLFETVETIYKTFQALDAFLDAKYQTCKRLLPQEITFISSQELEDLYPLRSPKEREYEITKTHGAVFLYQIGDLLKSGNPHDSRSPDYDDWSLNGDILFWNPILKNSLELSSMGIRVSPKSLVEQLKKARATERLKLDYHTMLVDGQLPYTIGGGIGQSRMCMFFLQKAHIGEVQQSVWPESMRRTCAAKNIHLL